MAPEAALPRSNAEVFGWLAEGRGEYLVDSPPGAGKTTLVAELAAFRALELGQRVLVATLTHSAADEVCRKLLATEPAPPTFRLRAANEPLPDERLIRATTLPYAEFGAPHVAVATLAKLATLGAEHAGAYDVCLVDEAYLVRRSDLAPAELLGRQLILIGDPGQLPPVAAVEPADWRDLPDGPHLAAPKALQWQRRQPGAGRPALQQVRLPHTFRMRPDTARLVQRHFYPGHPFTAALPDAPARWLNPAAPAPGPGATFDPLLDQVAGADTSLALGLLPPLAERGRGRDEAMPACVVALVERLLGRTRFGPAEVAVLASHREDGGAIRTALRRRLGEAGALVWCDTVERAQGREWPVVIGLHPLSGVREAGAFELEPGRLCVMLSRATTATLLLCREGVGPMLNALEAPAGTLHDAARLHRRLLREVWDAGRAIRCRPPGGAA